jgi:hypothetical protein
MLHRFIFAILLSLGASSAPALAQFLSVGVEAGIPLNDIQVNSGTLTASTNRYTIGPKLELRLPFRLGVEADALYRHYSLNGTGANEWDFPILLKYHFKGIPLVHPFVDAGPIFNHVTDISFVTPNQSTAGIAIGGGVDFHALILHIAPEIRYIHWGNQNYNFAALGSSLAANQNQAQFLVGITF